MKRVFPEWNSDLLTSLRRDPKPQGQNEQGQRPDLSHDSQKTDVDGESLQSQKIKAPLKNKAIFQL